MNPPRALARGTWGRGWRRWGTAHDHSVRPRIGPDAFVSASSPPPRRRSAFRSGLSKAKAASGVRLWSSVRAGHGSRTIPAGSGSSPPSRLVRRVRRVWSPRRLALTRSSSRS